MISVAITLMIFTLLFLIIGLIKPKWIFWWSKNPERFWIIVISVVMIMVTVTLFGEGVKRKHEADQAARENQAQAQENADPAELEKQLPVEGNKE
ncbi:MAG: hypothetical protein ACU833_00355 [Gammaproteobacteria bacterium]